MAKLNWSKARRNAYGYEQASPDGDWRGEVKKTVKQLLKHNKLSVNVKPKSYYGLNLRVGHCGTCGRDLKTCPGINSQGCLLVAIARREVEIIRLSEMLGRKRNRFEKPKSQKFWDLYEAVRQRNAEICRLSRGVG